MRRSCRPAVLFFCLKGFTLHWQTLTNPKTSICFTLNMLVSWISQPNEPFVSCASQTSQMCVTGYAAGRWVTSQFALKWRWGLIRPAHSNKIPLKTAMVTAIDARLTSQACLSGFVIQSAQLTPCHQLIAALHLSSFHPFYFFAGRN